MITSLMVVSLILFIAAAYLYARGRDLSDTLLASGLAVFMVAAVIFTLEEPQPPIPPTPTGDFGGYRPHYQGHGTQTKGGRGGTIYRVGNAQQFRDAIAADGPRIIVFDVSGYFDMGGQLSVTNPFLTIAGQTATDDGVALLNTRLLIDTHDVVVQHIKVRLPPQSLNACSIGDAGDGGDNSHVYNVVLDHVTCTWAKDVNNLLVAGPGSHDIAILDSLVGEGLWTGFLGGIGAGIGYKNTVARNLFTQHWSRQPIWGAPAELALYNNVTYNGTDNSHGYDTLPAFFGDADADNPFGTGEETVIMNNVLIAGPNSGNVRAILGLSKRDTTGKIYMEGNQGPGIIDDNWPATVCVGSYGNYSNQATCGSNSNMRTNELFSWWNNFKFVIIPTTSVLERVLANVGSRPSDRDEADIRMINDVMNGTGTHFLDTDSIELPEILATTRVCQLPSNPNEVVDEAGRTRIEVYLESDSQCGAKRLER